MKSSDRGLVFLSFLLVGALASFSARAQVVDLTSDGSAIEGLDYSGDYSQTGSSHFHAGDAGNLTDNNGDGSPNLGSQADTFNDTGAQYVNGHLDDSSYVGFTFASPLTQYVTSMTVNFHLFGDGGWFGQHNTAGTSPLAPVLIEPIVQVFNGTSWSTVTDTSTYLAVVGADNPASGTTGTVTFTLASPESGIDGIRVTGLSGGYAGQQQGFIGVADERLYGAVPEPSTYLLVGFGFVALLGLGRLRRSA